MCYYLNVHFQGQRVKTKYFGTNLEKVATYFVGTTWPIIKLRCAKETISPMLLTMAPTTIQQPYTMTSTNELLSGWETAGHWTNPLM